MNQTIYGKMADLLLFAVGFRRGDKIYLKYDRGQEELALLVTDKAYAGGAQYVLAEIADARFTALGVRAERDASWFPEHWKAKMEETIQPGWKYVSILSGVDTDAFEHCDGAAASRFFRDLGAAVRIRQEAIMKNAVPWTLSYVPSETMARKAFPNLDGDEAIARYWDAVIRIMRLDLEDPVSFWKEKMERDAKRSAFMDSLGATALRFSGPGTDLTVGLAPAARWIGGFDHALEGTDFMANIPTEEIFTSPHWERTEGRVRLTRPFTMHQNLGPVPVNAWFEFRKGQVVDYGADEGAETLKAFFDIDSRSRYLGEVALVDPSSPMAREGIVFHNGLYDENAACHVALGKAYPFTLRERRELDNEGLLSLGLNTGSVHEDMMIGGDEVDVFAVLPDGSERAIILGGKFLI